MIDGNVLVLNRSFTPIHITSIKKAICMVYKGLAQVIDEQYQSHDFQTWAELSVAMNEDCINLTHQAIRVPRIIILHFYDRLPRRDVKLTRENVYLRDKSTCQYCKKKHKRADLNLDHVVPVSQGGKTTWDNIVCSCLKCNNKKGGRTPLQAKMKLVNKPVRPKHSIFMNVRPKQKLFDIWHVFMNPVDYAYWNLELKEE
jgi:5-methylcytosine-specific restriction endonuclease McrA